MLYKYHKKKGSYMTKLAELQKQLAILNTKEESAEKQLKLAKERKLEVKKKQKEVTRKIEKEISEKARKERTKRLIEIGGLVEKYAGGEVDLVKFERYANQFSIALANLKKDY